MRDDERTCGHCAAVLVCDLTRGWISVHRRTEMGRMIFTRYCRRVHGAPKVRHLPIPLDDSQQLQEWLDAP